MKPNPVLYAAALKVLFCRHNVAVDDPKSLHNQLLTIARSLKLDDPLIAVNVIIFELTLNMNLVNMVFGENEEPINDQVDIEEKGTCKGCGLPISDKVHRGFGPCI